MLSDTQLALASLEISLLKLAKGEREKKKHHPLLVTQSPGGGFSGKCRVILLILITHSHWLIQEGALKKPQYNEKQNEGWLGQTTGVCSRLKPPGTL